jgi:hypothetical protein
MAAKRQEQDAFLECYHGGIRGRRGDNPFQRMIGIFDRRQGAPNNPFSFPASPEFTVPPLLVSRAVGRSSLFLRPQCAAGNVS